MAKTNFILFASDTAWHAGAGESLIEIPIPAGATPDQIASSVADSLKQLGHGASPLTLAIPSNWCLAAAIRTDDLPKSDYLSLLYRLEEKLPWPAESITADFIRYDDTALGVCIKTEKLRPLIDALESQGIPIQTITPTAFLAAVHSEGLLIIQSADHVDLLALKDDKPIAWSVATTDESDIQLQLKLLCLDFPDLQQIKLEEPTSLALRASRQTPLINLRQHDLAARDKLRLHRRPLNALLASAAILLIALTGLFVLRSHQYQQQSQQSSQQLERAFSTHFPSWDTPPNIKAVIESEHRRLITSPSTDLPPEATVSAVPILYSLLSHLPPDAALNVQHLTINPDSLDLDAQLKNYEDADPIAAAVRKIPLDVPPPQVRKDSNNLWSLSLHATKPKPLADAAK